MTKNPIVTGVADKAKAEIAKSTAGVRGYVQSFMTSRVSMALSMALFVAFSSTAIYAPNRIAPLANLDLVQQNLMSEIPGLDLSNLHVTADQQKQQASNLLAQAAPYVAHAYDYANRQIPHLAFWIDAVGALVSLALLLYTVRIQVRAARLSTPVSTSA